MFERYTSKLLLSPKTSLGGYVFDIYSNINHNLNSTITSHPTQFGANVSDHVIEEPDMLTFQIGMSDASQDLIKGQFNKRGLNEDEEIYYNNSKPSLLNEDKIKQLNTVSNSRSVNAYLTLSRLKLKGIPMTCVTRLRTYNNMLIQSINVDDTIETKYGLRATVVMKEVLITELQKIQANSTAQTTQTTQKGSTNALDFDIATRKEFTSTDFDEFGLGEF